MVRVSDNNTGTKVPRPNDDRVDRGVVLNEWVKSAAKFALRMLVIAVFVFAVAKLIGALWAGILPAILALIICTVLAPIATWMRHHKVPSGLALSLIHI